MTLSHVSPLERFPSRTLTSRDGELYLEDVGLARVAEQFGTPCYVYSRAELASGFQAFDGAFGARAHLICYGVKASSNLAVLNEFSRLGSGFDIVSGGELARVIAAGGDPGKVVFSGVGKTPGEIRQALEAGILCFNVESQSELARISRIAVDAGKTAPVSLRVNPDVDPKTHPYISTGLKQNKFGVPFDDALRLYREAAQLPGVRVAGIDYHIGSQITEMAPFVEALQKVLGLIDELERAGIHLAHLDVGGGLGIRYRDESPPEPSVYVRRLVELLGARPQRLIVENGRALVGNAGVLITRVQYLKHGPERNFAVVDAAMNDLVRPALYGAYHRIEPVSLRGTPALSYEVVGPVCESADFLGHDRELAIEEGDLLAVLSAGAYAMSYSSNLNTRPRAAEVMVDGGRTHLIRERERAEQLFALERLLP